MHFVDATDVDLLGVMNTVAVALPHLPDGASIIITGSTAGMIKGTSDNPMMGPGGAGYGWSKRSLIEYVEQMCLQVAPQDDSGQRHAPDQRQHPPAAERRHLQRVPAGHDGRRQEADPRGRRAAFTYFNAMPIPYIEPEDIANLGVFLASEESRYITGQQIRVDAGSMLKWPNGPGG